MTGGWIPLRCLWWRKRVSRLLCASPQIDRVERRARKTHTEKPQETAQTLALCGIDGTKELRCNRDSSSRDSPLQRQQKSPFAWKLGPPRWNATTSLLRPREQSRT
eukprot:scaffold680_cov264-Pinguiococcus_pyrenoidosus.AAC.18